MLYFPNFSIMLFGSIDLRTHYRQDSLGFEDLEMKTHPSTHSCSQGNYSLGGGKGKKREEEATEGGSTTDKGYSNNRTRLRLFPGKAKLEEHLR